MRVATRVRKWIYPAVLILLPLAIIGSSSGRALAQTPTPVAAYVGADAESMTPTWTTADTPGSEYYLGSLKSQKIFYNNEALPDSDAAYSSTYPSVPGCGAKNPDGSYVYGTNVLCIVVWDDASKPYGEDLASFLKSTEIDKQHQYLMAYCNEPEIHQGSGGCMCNPSLTSGEIPCGGASNFIAQFNYESQYITNFETTNGMSNVHVAEDSWAGYYKSNPGDCSFIVPSSSVSDYLVDVYEKDQTTIPGYDLGQDQGWTNWLGCTSAANGTSIGRGIAEYGIDCNPTSKDDAVIASTFKVDAQYLLQNQQQLQYNMEVWNLWDTGGCAIGNNPADTETYAPMSVTAWQNIEAGNIGP